MSFTGCFITIKIVVLSFYSKMKGLTYIALVLLGFAILSCERDDFSSSPSITLNFSADTVLFDTVFTAIGSSTHYLKVYNRSKSDVRISSIRLAGGESSCYRINVDGMSGYTFEDVPLRSKDSLFIFVEVTVDPTLQDAPLLIPDSIVFNTNGNVQDVKLVAWGQDVHLLNARVIENDTIFLPDKPYLIYDYLLVKPDVELRITQGVKLYFHNSAQLVVAGTLTVDGDAENPVTFEGDRLERYYSDKAGQWGGIWLYAGSRNNSIRWAAVKNSIIGLMVDTCVTANAPTLTMSHTRIENSSYIGLLARGSKIVADNCLVANTANVTIALTLGGAYQFYHCTFANYWGDYMFREGPILLLNNYYRYQLVDDGPYYTEPRDLTEASFYNSIIYGSVSNELSVDNSVDGSVVDAQMNYFFQDCILKVSSGFDLSDESRFKNVLKLDPKFKDPYGHIYLLDTLSPARSLADIAIAGQFPVDLNNYNRLSDGFPDLGAFERQE